MKMSLKEKLQASFNIIISSFALIVTVYTVIELMLFLSNPNSAKAKQNSYGLWISVSWSLFADQLLLSLFLLQHSVLALPEVKNWIASTLKVQLLQRSVYIISTSFTLQVIIKYWHATPDIALWTINTNSKLNWWCFIMLHGLAWAVIYVGTICMDVNELLGIKQVYYGIQHLSDPNSYKSVDLKRLYAHMRHPSFIGFLIILWAIPCMSLDRLLLAIVWCIYMYLAWNTDKSDYHYQRQQFYKKFQEFNYVK